jgi:hypothetical protein
MNDPIPVALFAYARPKLLSRTLECLRENEVPRLVVFCDGPRSEQDRPGVDAVRQMVYAIDWCDVEVVERTANLGLGPSILAGVTEMFHRHEALLVFEDDLVCVPGTYAYLSACLKHYGDDSRVMSVTGWTHPLVTPSDVVDQPYFDGRAECWVWGAWRRSWTGMDECAKSLVHRCAKAGIDEYAYGRDLVVMADEEKVRNTWAVRFLFLHILRKGLCLRPPWSLVNHIGIGDDSSNAKSKDAKKTWWFHENIEPCPSIPTRWPAVIENAECGKLWQQLLGPRPTAAPSLARRMIDYAHARWRRLIRLD